MRIDLHMHTTASDGALSPAETVAHAIEARLDVISITDHDSCEGVAEAVEAAQGSALTVISGTELSSARDRWDIHILGYGVDPAAPGLEAHAKRARGARLHRMEEMVRRLESDGVDVDLEAVLAEAGGEEGMVGRPHLAAALLRRGVVQSISHAFDTLIGNQHGAFVPTTQATPEDAIETIRDAGGVAVWAHPPGRALEEFLPALMEAGLQGLEAYRPGWNPQRQRRVARLARSRELLVTGGSDWHGQERNGGVGHFYVQENQVSEFLDAVGLARP